MEISIIVPDKERSVITIGGRGAEPPLSNKQETKYKIAAAITRNLSKVETQITNPFL